MSLLFELLSFEELLFEAESLEALLSSLLLGTLK
jgi:hypothetical protein